MSIAKLTVIAFFLLVVLSVRMIFFYGNLPIYREGQKIKFFAKLSEEPQLVSGRQQFRVKTPDGLGLSIVTGASPIFAYGDRISIEGKLRQKYSRFVIYYPLVKKEESDKNIITQIAVLIRKRAKSLYEGTLPPVSASLLSGILFGGKQGMPDDFLRELRSVGVLHVIAASGMNVSFVAGALIFTLGSLFKRQLALVLGIFGVIFYALLAGFEPSILRASIMAILAFSASLLGRQNIALLSVFLTAYVMLFFNPLLLSDIGFQLSFLSTLGILLIKPILPFGQSIILSDDIGTTIAAQIATLPVMLIVFGEYGLLSILVNALVLWTVPILMFLGSIALLVGLFFEPLGKLILFFTLPFLLLFEKIVSFFGGFGLRLTVDSFPTAGIIGYYLLLLGFILFLKSNKKAMEITSSESRPREIK